MSAALVLAAALHLGGGGDGQSAPPDDRLQVARVERLVSAAHLFLVEHQNPDGSFSVMRNDASHAAPVAVTSLAALSLMASGHLPDRGRHAEAVRRAVDWLVQHQDGTGFFTTDSDTVSRMHGHGYAVLALTQAFGMEPADAARREDLRGAIQRGVDVIEASQGEQGGWFYEPRRTADHEGSVTVCMIQALRGARDIGFAVHKLVIDRALEYMKNSQDDVTGRFRYRINDEKMSWALTAAALSTLNSAGDYSSRMLDLGFDAMQRYDPFVGTPSDSEFFIDYGALYAAQAYWQHADGKPFGRWWPRFVQDSEERQRADGSFDGGEYGKVYGTAIVSLTLQVPLGYLPLFQR